MIASGLQQGLSISHLNVLYLHDQDRTSVMPRKKDERISSFSTVVSSISI